MCNHLTKYLKSAYVVMCRDKEEYAKSDVGLLSRSNNSYYVHGYDAQSFLVRTNQHKTQFSFLILTSQYLISHSRLDDCETLSTL